MIDYQGLISVGLRELSVSDEKYNESLETAREISERIKRVVGERLHKIILFGSMARGS